MDPLNVFTEDDDFKATRPYLSATYQVTDVAQSTDTAGSAFFDLVVPTTHDLYPFRITVSSNAARTAGTATAKVTDAGTAIVGGPEAVLDATDTLTAEGRVQPGSIKIDAGQVVNVTVTGDGTWAPATADLAVKVYYYLQATS